MEHVRVKFNQDYANVKAGSCITFEDFKGIPHTPPLLKLGYYNLIHALSDFKILKVIYPMYYVGLVEHVDNRKEVVIYCLDSEANYKCSMSKDGVPYSFLSKSNFKPFFDYADAVLYTSTLNKQIVFEQKTVIKLDGEVLEPGRSVFYIRMSDGACGQVAYYEGFKEVYPNKEYLFFLSCGERDNAAYRIMNGTFVDEKDPFNDMSFSGEQIKEALRNNASYEDTDEYWEVALSVINYLKNKKKA